VKKVKKSLLRRGSRDRLWTHGSNSLGFSSPRPSERFRQLKCITHISDFVKQIRGSYSDRCRPGAGPGRPNWRAICAPNTLMQVNFAPNTAEFRAIAHAFQLKNSGVSGPRAKTPGVLATSIPPRCGIFRGSKANQEPAVSTLAALQDRADERAVRSDKADFG
jgi:hypothetical protein